MATARNQGRGRLSYLEPASHNRQAPAHDLVLPLDTPLNPGALEMHNTLWVAGCIMQGVPIVVVASPLVSLTQESRSDEQRRQRQRPLGRDPFTRSPPLNPDDQFQQMPMHLIPMGQGTVTSLFLGSPVSLLLAAGEQA
ncbi:hypothetical protein BX600DRAFT_434507 [Xylariales sp. PMI_506]|nr:hypothetical protein BX600DRAFT_434507 [Xylariales sp. PMI_506]